MDNFTFGTNGSNFVSSGTATKTQDQMDQDGSLGSCEEEEVILRQEREVKRARTDDLPGCAPLDNTIFGNGGGQHPETATDKGSDFDERAFQEEVPKEFGLGRNVWENLPGVFTFGKRSLENVSSRSNVEANENVAMGPPQQERRMLKARRRSCQPEQHRPNDLGQPMEVLREVEMGFDPYVTLDEATENGGGTIQQDLREKEEYLEMKLAELLKEKEREMNEMLWKQREAFKEELRTIRSEQAVKFNDKRCLTTACLEMKTREEEVKRRQQTIGRHLAQKRVYFFEAESHLRRREEEVVEEMAKVRQSQYLMEENLKKEKLRLLEEEMLSKEIMALLQKKWEEKLLGLEAREALLNLKEEEIYSRQQELDRSRDALNKALISARTSTHDEGLAIRGPLHEAETSLEGMEIMSGHSQLLEKGKQKDMVKEPEKKILYTTRGNCNNCPTPSFLRAQAEKSAKAEEMLLNILRQAKPPE